MRTLAPRARGSIAGPAAAGGAPRADAGPDEALRRALPQAALSPDVVEWASGRVVDSAI